jgi:hypothetical protein
MIKRTRLTLAALGLLFAAGRLDAATITYDFTGTVFNNSINPFGVTDQAGAAVTGTLSYDTAVADGDPDPARGVYVQTGFAFEFTFASGATVMNPGEFGIFILENNVVVSAEHALVNGVQYDDATALFVLMNSKTPFSSDALPAALNLADFELPLGGLEDDFPKRLGVEFSIDTLTPHSSLEPVPEPGTLLLLISGLSPLVRRITRTDGRT